MVRLLHPSRRRRPHIDNYDVFITQGQGRKRHWRVGMQRRERDAAHAALLHCEPFEAIIDVIMGAGRHPLHPPGFPNEGYAIEPP